MTPTTKINYKFREHVHEVHGQDNLGLGGKELAPGRTRPARRGIDASIVQDLPHRGGRDAMAKLEQFALHPPVPPARVLGCHAHDQFLDRRGGRRTSESAACGGVPFP